MNECCGTCKFNKFDRDDTGEFICNNENGEFNGTFTAYDDCCDEYQEKE